MNCPLVGVVLLSFVRLSFAQPDSSSLWPVRGGDNSRSGRSESGGACPSLRLCACAPLSDVSTFSDFTGFSYGPASTPDLLWSFDSGRPIAPASPVIGGDGVVYTPSRAGTITALDGLTGTVLWTAAPSLPGISPAEIWASPALSATSVFVGSRNGVFQSLSRTTGAVQWTRLFNTSLTSPDAALDAPPVLAASGAIIIGSNDFAINSLDARTGQLIWRTGTRGRVMSCECAGTPVLHAQFWLNYHWYLFVADASFAAGGELYIGCNDHLFRTLAPNGSLKWAVDLGSDPTPAAIDQYGTIFVGDSGGSIRALSPENGSALWSFSTGHKLVRGRGGAPYLSYHNVYDTFVSY